jgi:hypothetical protein
MVKLFSVETALVLALLPPIMPEKMLLLFAFRLVEDEAPEDEEDFVI